MTTTRDQLDQLHIRLVDAFEREVEEAIESLRTMADVGDRWSYDEGGGRNGFSAYSVGPSVSINDDHACRTLFLPDDAMDSLAAWWLRYRAAEAAAS